MARMPTAEVDFGPDLVQRLLSEQHPDLLAGREVTMFANGWDNAILRLGDDLLVRLPRRELAAGLVEHEQEWLPRLADRLPASVPVPVRVGTPGADFPWRWSVLRWLPGDALATVPLADRSPALAAGLGRFLAALHTPADDDVWRSPYRGGSLADRRPQVEQRIGALGERAAGLLARWREVAGAPGVPTARLWVHGDVHPLNILVDGDSLTAVIDWGDLTAGDPACDLAIAWLGFTADAAAALRTAYAENATHDLDPGHLWARAEAWAIHLSTMLLANSDDHPELEAIGAHGLGRLERT